MAAIYGSLTSADLENSASDPSTPTTGRIYLNTSSHEVKGYINAGWKTFMDLSTAQTATNKTFTSPVINTSISGTAFLDEDDMVSNSATKVASQQSIRAYVDTSVAAVTGASDSVDDRWNYSIAASAAAGALTIALKDADGNDPSAGSPVKLAFRNTTITTGTYSVLSRASALSIVIPSTATLGWSNGDVRYIYVFGLNNSGAFDDLIVASRMLDENALHTTTAIDTGADSETAKYSNSARTDMSIRFLAKIRVTITTAGTWLAPDEISITRQPLSPTVMDNAEATRNGRKQYLHGTTYNNGVAPTVTTNASSGDVKRAQFTPYLSQDGTWYLNGTIAITHGSDTGHTLTINGVVFKNTTGFTQAITCGADGTQGAKALTTINTANVAVTFASGSAATYLTLSNIELNEKPTWVYG